MWPDLIKTLESDLNIKNKVSYINTFINVHGLNLEIESEISLVKTKVKEFCAEIITRTEGLLLLYAVVHCSSTLYIDNWSQMVLASLQCPDSIIPREIPLEVLKKVLINFGSESDYRDVLTKVTSEILPFILNPEDDKVYKLSCQTLAVCMKYVPEATGTRVADIEKLLLKELDNPYGETIEAVGECFAALPLSIMHAQKTGSVEYKEIWCNIFTKLLNTMDLLLNDILKLSEDEREYVDVSGLPVFDLPFSESNNNVPVIQIDVFKSLCQCMAKMMSSENRFVRLPITDLLRSLFRIFNVAERIKGQNLDGSVAYLKLGFPQMLNGLNVVLEALILNFSIVEQSQNFVSLMIMSLNSMKEGFPQSSVSQVRGSTWQLINVWLKCYGCKASFQYAKKRDIIPEILTDIDIVMEGENSKQSKTSYIKEKNQKANKVFACTHALKVLKTLVETGSGYIDKASVDIISYGLLRTAKNVIRHYSPKKQFPLPYSDEKCRKMLFDTLFTCAIFSDSLQSKCILETINICNAALRDTSAKIRHLSLRFRKLSRYYLNPRKPPPNAIQYNSQSMCVQPQRPVIESVRSEWSGYRWSNNANGRSSDDQMDENEVDQVQGENAYSDKVESESDLMPIDQIEETESRMNHEYRRIAKHSSQSMGEEESNEDSDLEPTYISTDSNPQRIHINDSVHVNSYGMQTCVEQYHDESRTERQASEAVVPNMTNNVENNIGGHMPTFVEVKATGQKIPQVPMGNGEWKKKENVTESDEDESDMEEEVEEEAEPNEEISDNAADEGSDGKRSPEFDEERPRKRQRCMDDEGDDDMDEEDEEVPVNNQSSDEEGNGNNLVIYDNDAGVNSRNLVDEDSRDDNEDIECKSPTIREMCGDFVLAEPAAADTS